MCIYCEGISSQKTKPLSTINMITPDDFPDAYYEGIQSRLVNFKDSHNDIFIEYAGAFNAIPYRYIACTLHNIKFTKSILENGSTPLQPHRFIQEQELFYFFITGIATLDSFCYGLYAIASIIKPNKFPLTNKDKRNITVTNTAKLFEKYFSSEKISKLLKTLCDDIIFKNWGDTRNILAHRISSGRKITVVMGELHSFNVKGVNDLIIDENTTSQKYGWLSKILNELFDAANEFTQNNLK